VVGTSGLVLGMVILGSQSRVTTLYFINKSLSRDRVFGGTSGLVLGMVILGSQSRVTTLYVINKSLSRDRVFGGRYIRVSFRYGHPWEPVPSNHFVCYKQKSKSGPSLWWYLSVSFRL